MKRISSLLAIAALALGAFMALPASAQEAPTGSAAAAAAAPAAPAAPTENASASPAAPAPRTRKLVKARVLFTSHLGKCNDVIELDAADAKALEAQGEIDTEKAAVAYAESLVKSA